MTAEQKAFSIARLAEVYDLSPDSITKAIKNGDLAPRYFGTKPLIAVEEADRWFATLPEEKPARAS